MGAEVAVIGQGTWGMGESRRTEEDEIAARRLGIELGMTHIHTAERYADGGCERVVGRAVEDRRPLFGRFVVSFISENGREFQNIPLWLRWSS
jgi:aryl-alcohol dehydrogenase-like predicted oxidoreductase